MSGVGVETRRRRPKNERGVLTWDAHAVIAVRQVRGQLWNRGYLLMLLPFVIFTLLSGDWLGESDFLSRFFTMTWGFLAGLMPTMLLWEPGQLRALGFTTVDIRRNTLVIGGPMTLLTVVFAVLMASRMTGGIALGFFVVMGVTLVITVGNLLVDVRKKSEVTNAGAAGRVERMKAEKQEKAELREGAAGAAGAGGAGGAGVGAGAAPWWKQVLFTEAAQESPRSPVLSYLLMTAPMRACGAWLLLALSGSVLVFMVPWYVTGSEALVSKWFWVSIMAGLSVVFLGGAVLGETLRGWLVFNRTRREWLREALRWNAAWTLMGPLVYLLGAAELGLLMLVAPRTSGPFSVWSWGSFLLGLAASVVVAGLLVALTWWVFIISARLRGTWLWVAVVSGCMACGFMLGVPMAYLEEAGASEVQYLLAGCGLFLVLGVLTSALVAWQLKRVDVGSGFSEAMGLRAEV